VDDVDGKDVEKSVWIFENNFGYDLNLLERTGDVEYKYVHISPNRLAEWANERGVSLSDWDRKRGVILVGPESVPHTKILADGLGLNFDDLKLANRLDILREFRVFNAGLLVGEDGEYFLLGSSGELVDLNGSSLIFEKKNVDRKNELDAITRDLFEEMSKREGNLTFGVLPT
jgi:hypothetical protein